MDAALVLDWRADAECADGGAVAREVDRILAGSSGPRRPLTARVEVTRTDARTFRVTLVTHGADASGRRTFEAGSCSEVTSASALILAIAVNPQLSAAPAEPPPPEPEKPHPPRPAPAEPTPNRVLVGASVAGDLGSLPSADGGFEVALGWDHGPLRVEAAGALLLASKATSAGAGADLSLQRLAARAGYLPLTLGSATLGPAAGLAIERVAASGFGGGQAFAPDATFLSASGGVLGVWPPIATIPRLSVRVLAEAVIPFERPSFVVRETAPAGPTVVHRTPAVAGRATLGVEVHFP